MGRLLGDEQTAPGWRHLRCADKRPSRSPAAPAARQCWSSTATFKARTASGSTFRSTRKSLSAPAATATPGQHSPAASSGRQPARAGRHPAAAGGTEARRPTGFNGLTWSPAGRPAAAANRHRNPTRWPAGLAGPIGEVPQEAVDNRACPHLPRGRRRGRRALHLPDQEFGQRQDRCATDESRSVGNSRRGHINRFHDPRDGRHPAGYRCHPS